MLRKRKGRTCKPEDRSFKHIDIIKYLSQSFSALAVPEYKIFRISIFIVIQSILGKWLRKIYRNSNENAFGNIVLHRIGCDTFPVAVFFSSYFTFKLPGLGLEGIF